MVGPIGPDQVRDYAQRKGVSLEQAQKWLAPNLPNTPEMMPAALLASTETGG
jgi:5-methyltetrahydrofolate--homocysteine methyltransferase